MVAFEPGLVADLPPGRGRPPQPGEVALPLERWERPHRGHRLEPHRHHLGQPHAHLAPVEADEPDLELNWGRIGHVTRKRMKHPCNLLAKLNWGRIGHVTRKRMKHPCNLLANIIRTSWPTRWPGSPDLANFFRIGHQRWESGAFWGRAAGTATGQ